MTRKEAIEIINNTSFFAPSMSEVDEALNMAIESLSIDVVRCKDCKHLKGNNGYDRPWCGLTEWMENSITKQLDDFCSYGERR